MSLHQDIREQMKVAMKARDAIRLNVLRGLMASFTNEAVSKKRKPDEELSDEEVLIAIGRAVKQRKDSIGMFVKGGRKDLVDAEKVELSILETYLPTQMSREEIEVFVKQKISDQSSALTKADLGKFLGMIMKELKGKADGALVKEVIDSIVV